VVFERQLRYQVLELVGFGPQLCHFPTGGLAQGVVQQSLLASFQKFFAPAVVKIRSDPFAPAQLADPTFPAQPLQHDPDLVIGRVLLARHPPNSADGRFGRVFLLVGHSASLRHQLWLESVPKLNRSTVPFGLTTHSGHGVAKPVWFMIGFNLIDQDQQVCLTSCWESQDQAEQQYLQHTAHRRSLPL
jgi:hypothetical protein